MLWLNVSRFIHLFLLEQDWAVIDVSSLIFLSYLVISPYSVIFCHISSCFIIFHHISSYFVIFWSYSLILWTYSVIFHHILSYFVIFSHLQKMHYRWTEWRSDGRMDRHPVIEIEKRRRKRRRLFNPQARKTHNLTKVLEMNWWTDRPTDKASSRDVKINRPWI